APLPAFSTESLGDVEEHLQHIAHTIGQSQSAVAGREQTLSFWEAFEPLPASLRFALDMALLDLWGKVLHQPIKSIFGETATDTISLNGLIGLHSIDECKRIAAKLVKEGYKTLKLKLGRPTPEDDLRCVKAVSEIAGNRICLRLDPNQAWNQPDAEKVLPKLEEFPIEYIEQPIPAGGIKALLAFRDASPVPIALDAIPAIPERIIAAIEAEAMDAIILKPTLLGGFRTISDIIDVARQHQIKTVFTSALENSVALAGIAQLAAWFAPEVSHGLSTTTLFSFENLLTKPYQIVGGSLKLPAGPGLGLALQPDEVQSSR
ncbi:MAG: enolase C-terminal domain-like protein, partial [Calditrichota bacterium]